MSITFSLEKQEALASTQPIHFDAMKAPQYGRYFETLFPGQIFAHPRGFTFERTQAQNFARSFLQSNPLYFHNDFARAHGFSYAPVNPMMVFQAVRSMICQDITEKAFAEHRCINALFLQPVYPGDILTARTQVAGRQGNVSGQAGLILFRTIALNQNEQVVMRYEHQQLIPMQNNAPEALPISSGLMPTFRWSQTPEFELPIQDPSTSRRHQFRRSNTTETVDAWSYLTGSETYFEDFSPGQIILHSNGKTIAFEHLAWQSLLASTHPQDLFAFVPDRENADVTQPTPSPFSSPEQRMPVANGLLFAWLDGLASRDISENAVWDLGFTDLQVLKKVSSGDTLFALSRVLDIEDAPEPFSKDYGILTVQLIGIKNMFPEDALQEHGSELLTPSNNPPGARLTKGVGHPFEAISPKVFEVERRLLLKKNK